MKQKIYVSCPWAFSSGLGQVVKYLKQHTGVEILYSKKGEDYQFSKLEQANHVVFVLDGFSWQSKLESISKGMLTELMWCINHKISFYLAYRASTGLGIYSAEIDENLQFKGIAGTANNIFTVLSGVNNIQECCSMRYHPREFTIINSLVSSETYLKGELLVSDPLDFLNEEQPSYFY